MSHAHASTEGGAERVRLAEADAGRRPWREWGPYVSCRAWGTVREDYSADGDAWGYFPFDHAVSRAYRWNEDGLLAWCDDRQLLCVGLALWNGVDPVLKERPFGLAGPEGNHGEDVKEYWWYRDCTPTGSYACARYLYPTRQFPYADLRATNAARGRDVPEYELLDTGVLDEERYIDVVMEWAKAGPRDLCLRVTLTNRGPEPVTLRVLPSAWFRNTWSWSQPPGPRPRLAAADGAIVGEHLDLGAIRLVSRLEPAASHPEPRAPALLFCDNETNVRTLFGADEFAGGPAPAYPKDGINDHVVAGLPTVNPEQVGTKAAFDHVVAIGAGESREIRVRLVVSPSGAEPPAPDPLGAAYAELLTQRKAEADEFWEGVSGDVDAETAHVVRQALAGLLWCRQFYAYDVARWLAGDPGEPPPPSERLSGRNARWRHLCAADVISMPDAWEYPWFASWDLAFQAVALSLVDPTLAKRQLLLLLDERYQDPDGQIPAYEWNFADLNPPVQAWAALQIYRSAGDDDVDFLEQVLHKLLMNVTWWLNREDADGDDLFEGGFLGLDNVGPFDRSQPLPDGTIVEQSDGTAWMAMYMLDLLAIAVELGRRDPTYDGLAATFLDRFCAIANAANTLGTWSADDGFFYDLLRHDGTPAEHVLVRSAVGLIPLLAVGPLTEEALAAMPRLAARWVWLREHRPERVKVAQFDPELAPGLLAMCDRQQLLRVLHRVLDPAEFLSAHGIRSLSRDHRAHPVTLTIGDRTHSVDYEPAESRSAMYGGNSNWRGPVWMPINVLLVDALRRFAAGARGVLQAELPSGSGQSRGLDDVADDLVRRVLGLFLPAADGRRPGQPDLPWQDDVVFSEFFDGDTGKGLGASHQTGWTALIGWLVLRSGRSAG